ncbi:hypothetical protein HEK131_24120 [Streptomyces seoulensis]|nr:hypothetical protein HEK131_24120 [Streptomyces seoulensis]
MRRTTPVFAARPPACSPVPVEEADHGCPVPLPDDTRLRVRWINPPVHERARAEARVGDPLAPAPLEAPP